MQVTQPLTPDRLAALLGRPTGAELLAERVREDRERFAEETALINEARRLRRIKETPMTVSLYKSTASGSREIVVQTNAQSLRSYILDTTSITA